MLFKNVKEPSEKEQTLPIIKPLLRKRFTSEANDKQILNPMDPRVIISEQSITQRYLTRNVFQGSTLNKKESVRESLENIKKIQYATINIKDKKEESEKLNDWLDQQREALEAERLKMK